MSREIEAPYKPKKGDRVAFNGPRDPGQETQATFHGHIMKVLKNSNVVHIEATGGKWYEADLDEDNVRLVERLVGGEVHNTL